MKNISLLFAGLMFYAASFGIAGARAATEISDPAFSFDAKKIAYVVGEFIPEQDDPNSFTIKSAQIWTANVNGSGAARVTSEGININARWSPDGKQLAFVRKGDIWLIDTDGSGLKQITKTPKADEYSPEFSNDGKLLFFVRAEYINAAEFQPGVEPILFGGSGAVFAYSLVSGEERQRFESLDDVKQIVPNRADAGEVFLFYQHYDEKVKTKYGVGGLTDMVVAAAKLDGSGRRIIQRQPENMPIKIQAIRATLDGPLIQSERTDEDGDGIPLFSIATKNGMKEVDDGPFVFNDISLDGNFMIGLGSVYTGEGAAQKMEISLKIRNMATEKTTSLDRSTLLGLKAAAPPATPVVATTPTAAAIPTAAKAHFGKAEAHLKIGATGDALEEFSEAIKLHPNYAEAYLKRGAVYAKRLEFQDALTDFDAAIRLRPADGEAYMARGAAHQELDEIEKAISDYTDATVFSEHPAQAYHRRAVLLRKQGFLKLAEKDEWDAKKPENQ